MNDLKQKLRNREFVKGTYISLHDASVSELCGMTGYDFLWIDTEHTALDYYTLETHIIAAKAGGTKSIVRIPWNDPVLAKRVLDQGPDGIIFPVINTPEELDKAMKSTLYPPEGNRGFAPIRGADYGVTDINDYIHRKTFDIIRCVQLESWIAVENLEEMGKNPWVDCFIFGPCDLSGSVGQLNDVFGSETQEQVKKAIAILKKAGKSIGVATGSDQLEVIKRWYDLGINFICAGADYSYITTGARKVLDILNSLEKQSD